MGTVGRRTVSPMIEKHSTGYMTCEDRHGNVRDLFTLWFGGNIAPLPIVTDAPGVQIFHLNLMWGIVALVVGQAVGGVLLVVLVPWTAINMIDFYVIHKGKYDIESIFRVDGGIYGRFNPRALIVYAIGVLVQIPFMNTPMDTGPIPAHLGGADLSWLAGLVGRSLKRINLANDKENYSFKSISDGRQCSNQAIAAPCGDLWHRSCPLTSFVASIPGREKPDRTGSSQRSFNEPKFGRNLHARGLEATRVTRISENARAYRRSQRSGPQRPDVCRDQPGYRDGHCTGGVL